MRPRLAQLRRQLTDARWPFKVAGIVALTALLATCAEPPTVLEQVRQLGELRVVTRNSPTTYYLGVDGPEGPEFELATRFAAGLGVPARFQLVASGAAALEEVRRNRAHLAAAAIVVTGPRSERVSFGPSYHSITEHVVRRADGPSPAGPADLAGLRIEVVAGSAHAEALAALATEVPGLVYVEVPGVDQMDLLARVSGGTADLAVADSTEFAIARHFHPDLQIAFDLPDQRAVAWAFNRRDDSLLAPASALFARLQAQGELDPLLTRYYRPSDVFDYVHSMTFVRHVQERLPALRPWFEAAALANGFDWRLLAAVAYQESKWDTEAVSRTGVRGVMMLTHETARRVGVTDRSDPWSSILGGAAYLREIHGKFPARIGEPDRTWLMLAAYNVGFGHLEDARILAQRDGANPDSWQDVRRYLPLLAQERWYTQTRRGYARGWEPVHFVRNVRRYLDVLVWMTGAPDSGVRVTAGTGQAPAPPPAE